MRRFAGPRWAGRSLLAAGLAVWAVLSLAMLPYGYIDLAYVLSLEQGWTLKQQWVHPLYMPLLRVLAFPLRLAGVSRMLVPLEVLDVAVTLATLAGLYAVLERRGAEPVRTGALVLAVAFSHGFWEGALRPTPYALASAALAACVLTLTSPRRRPALAGALGGVAAGLHLAAVVLGPAGWLVSRRGERARFLKGFGGSLAASYAAFVVFPGPPLRELLSPARLLRAVEQMPLSSVHTAPDLRALPVDYLGSLGVQGGAALTLLAAVCLGAWLVRERGSAEGGVAPEERSGLLSAAAFAAFFLLNNTRNGWIYASVVCLLPAAAMASLPRRASAAAAAAGLAAACLGALRGLPDVPGADAQRVEGRFLETALGPRGLLLLPGCPNPELLYEATIRAAVLGPLDPGCAAPPEPEPRGRVERALAAGRSVWVSFGDLEADFGGDATGAQKRRQVFSTGLSRASDRGRRAAELRAMLEKDFRLAAPVRSPLGHEYRPLRLRKPLRAPPEAGAARAAAAPAGAPRAAGPGRAAVAGIRRAASGGGDLSLRARVDYLAGWVEAVPDDPDARADLAVALAGRLPPAACDALTRGDWRLLDEPIGSLRRRSEESTRLSDAAVDAFRKGKRSEAAGLLRKALAADSANGAALLSLGALLSDDGQAKEALPLYDRILEAPWIGPKLKESAASARASALARLGRKR